jgi:hypothetical protein
VTDAGSTRYAAERAQGELIVSALAAVLPLRVAEDSTGEIILFRRYKTDVP